MTSSFLAVFLTSLAMCAARYAPQSASFVSSQRDGGEDAGAAHQHGLNSPTLPSFAFIIASAVSGWPTDGELVRQPGEGEPLSLDATENPEGQPGTGQKGQPKLLQQMTAFKTDVPAHDVDVVLVRPADRSVTVTVAVERPARAIIEYWAAPGGHRRSSAPRAVDPGVVGLIELGGLSPGTMYRYRLGLIRDGATAPAWKGEAGFRTRPAPGVPFSLVIQADSHLDQGVEPKVYEQTLANMRAAAPDFMVDLGDTFMTDKRGADFKAAQAQYDAQRYYFGLVADSAPLFMVLGNHDGEKGTSGRAADDVGPWSYAQRTGRFPAPVIDGTMYTGATAMREGVGANYYAFEWGDALLIMLDPCWSTTDRVRGGGGGNRRADADPGARRDEGPLRPIDQSWTSTLGRAQYDWLASTLSSSNARHRFVFIHHLVGGIGGAESRGGVESSGYFEWGGKNADGSPGFAEHRPGWPMPIHDLLVKHRVSAVFHGHDHLYVHSQRDGVQYQCVPQPGNPAGNTRTAGQYGYVSGTIEGSPGYLRVSVAPSEARVEFIRTAIAEPVTTRQDRNRHRQANGEVVDKYTIPARALP